MQSYRIEAGKLAETWLILEPLGSAWPDATAQDHWTSAPPNSYAGHRQLWFVTEHSTLRFILSRDC